MHRRYSPTPGHRLASLLRCAAPTPPLLSRPRPQAVAAPGLHRCHWRPRPAAIQ
uniref:Uncharacterized protein n=1 Tax=Arundo donax TaxID=35708 RepID=A0A0A8XNC0_ARUDO